MSVDYKNTLNLPETKFPMRANLATRELERIEHWNKENIYGRILDKNKDKPTYILHDGPPFTNGDMHMGHLCNKNLKDIVLRYKAMRGHRTPMHPGWDCHGLPIEQQVLKGMGEAARNVGAAELRKKCAEFSQANIEKLRGQFQRMGILADWANEYKTMAPEYEAETLRAFGAFVQQGLVYRDLKAVIWSIPFRTALAEAEVEYKDHVSPSIWVPFFFEEEPTTALVIWTTTPWTIPSNRAVALSEKLDYVAVHRNGKKYIVAAALAEKFVATAGFEGATLGEVKNGKTFENKVLVHPFMKEKGKVVMADFVSAEDGTGCVHIAPGHGQEDYQLGRQLGIEIYCPVDAEGKYMDDGRIPQELVGKTTLEKNTDKGLRSEANEAVIAMLERSGHLLARKDYSHSYPFCWRSKTPIIFRAVPQWFIDLDKNDTRKKVLAAVDTAEWIPAQGRNRIKGSIESRPDWCISRQRPWGVPIPAFIKPDDARLIDAGVIEALAKKVAVHGTNIFFEWSAEKLLEGVTLPAGWNSKELRPETDTLDVWTESGTSNLAVLRRPGLSWPADLYLEGSDQHRGWFQSSLWFSVVNTGKAPYRKVLTHGFIVDQNRQKLSKSSGALPATEMIKKYGADVLRLWTASLDYSGDVPLSDDILAQVAGGYTSLRNTLRYQLANLSGFDVTKNAVPMEKMLPLDQWVVGKLVALVEEVTQAYEKFQFAEAYQLISRFAQGTLSAVYHDCIKDRMYTCAPNSLERLSAQTALNEVFSTLVRLLAPVMPFTADEAWCYRLGETDWSQDSVHLQDWPVVQEAWKKTVPVMSDVDEILKLRGVVNEKLEVMRKDKVIGKSLEAKILLEGNVGLLERYAAALPEIFIVSAVDLKMASGDVKATTAKADGHKCPRCWRYVAPAADALCERCQKTLASLPKDSLI